MNLYKAVGVTDFYKDADTNENVTFNEVYDRLVNFIGLKEILSCIPLTKKQVMEAYNKDKNLNSIPLSNWDRWAGFKFDGIKCIRSNSKLQLLLVSKGINSYSPSQLVSLLKHAALKYIGR